MARPSRARKLAAVLVLLSVLFGTLVSTSVEAQKAEAANGGLFNAGNIISDSVFYNPSTMSAAQIQAFLDGKVGRCAAGYLCVNNFTENTFTRAATRYCNTYSGVAAQRASDIIWSVAQACGINPQVLIVLLQKEQGLVSDSAPDGYQYRSATGYGCPDTAPCDAEYYGFYNQLYAAARQYKIYQAFPTEFSYVAGRVNSILWNPNGGCGSSQVYIENQATAGLYNYTPYRPNQAALNNLYGIGDGCSSYGNRNFFTYFSDWFGDPQASNWFVKSDSSPTIYLVIANFKYAMPSMTMLNSLYALGPYRVVSQSYLDSLTTGPDVSNFLRDSTTGEIFFAGDGVKNRFSSCDQLAAYGGTCAPDPTLKSYIDVFPSALQKFATGPAVTSFTRSDTTGQIYYVSGGLKKGVHSFAKIALLANGGPQTWISHSQTTLDLISSGTDYLDPGMLVHGTTDSTLYMTDGSTSIIRVPSTPLSTEFGWPGPSTVADITITSLATASAPLSVAVSCGSLTYVAGGGQLWSVPSASGLPVTSLEVATCAALPKSPQAVTGALFLRVASTGWIYYISNGKKLFMQTMDAVNGLNGANPLVMVPTDQTVIDTIPTGPDVLGIGALVKAAAAPTVYFVDGFSHKVPITSFAVASEFGSKGYSVPSDATLGSYATASAPLSVAVSCGTSTYVAGGGQLWSVPSASGLPVTALEDATCAALRKSPQSVTGALFLRVASTGWIYYISNGKKFFMSTMGAVYAANGSAPLVLVPTNQTVIDAIPSGPEILPIAALVKSASAPTVYFVDGRAHKVPIQSFELASEFGSSGYSVVADATLDTYATVSAPLSVAVSCGSLTYVAGGGQLWSVPSASGLPVTSLEVATCAALPKSPQAVTGALFLRVASTGWIYYISNGKKLFMQTMDAVNGLNGANPLVMVPTDQTVIDTIPDQ